MPPENEEEKITTSEGEPLNRVTTYQDAIKEALRGQDMSSAGMLMAEQKKRDDFQAESVSRSFSNPKNKLMVLISIILIVSAIAVVTFVIIRESNKTPPKTINIFESKYFISEKMIEVAASQLSRNTLARTQQALAEPISNGEIAQIVITKEVKEDPNSEFDIMVKTSYNTNDFLSLISARAPENIRKSLDPEFMLGMHRASKNETFVLFRITSFENAFSGMLTWESALARDMENIFMREIASARIITEEIITPEISTASSTEDLENSTTTATSTPEVIRRTIDNSRIWHDRVIRNTDTRALLDESGNVVFFYSIIDNEYIFFGSNEATFAEVVRRVRSSKLIR